MDIYLLIEGKQEGPYSEEQVRQSLASGQIPSDLPAWHEGLTEWMPVSSILPSHPSGPQVPPPLVPAPSLTRTDAPLIVPDESSEREFVSYLWYRSSVIVSLAIFIPFIKKHLVGPAAS